MSVSELARLAPFRRLFLSRVISSVGNGIGPIAVAFGVLGLPDGTPTDLSIVLAAQALPLVLMLPFGGVIADRLGRTRVIAATDMTLAFVVMTMGWLFISGNATVPLLAGLGVVAGLLNGMWFPAFTGLVPDVVAEEHLQTANAYVSVASNGGLIVGTSIGGLLVATIGAGPAILIDGVTFLLAGLLVLTLRHLAKPHDSGESVMTDLVHGWRVFVSYRWVVVIVGSASFIVMALRGAEEVLGPVSAKEHYNGPQGWSAVIACMAVGLLVGALVASRIRPARPFVVATLAMLAVPIWMVLLAVAAPLWLVALGAFAIGIALDLFGVLWYTVLQSEIPREALSRVSSYDALGSLMFGPLGLAVAGPLSEAVGLEAALLACAAIAAVATLGALAFPSVRGMRMPAPDPLPIGGSGG